MKPWPWPGKWSKCRAGIARPREGGKTALPPAIPSPLRLLLVTALGVAVLAAGCATAPYTGRRQLLLSSEGRETAMGLQAFQAMKRQLPPCPDPAVNALVQQVGGRIAAAAARPDFRWEFVVFQNDREANAFCLPGGKVGVFTGLLRYTQDETGLATVIAHEAAHALARHAGERQSQSTLAQIGSLGLGVGLGAVTPFGGPISQAAGLGTQMGVLLPYSRKQELEADRIGLILLAKAGYDPAAGVDFWQRMMTRERRGPDVPQFLSTHPKDAERLTAMQESLPEALNYYHPAIAGPAPTIPAPIPILPAPSQPRPVPPQTAPSFPAPTPPSPGHPPNYDDDLKLKPMSTGSQMFPSRQTAAAGQWVPQEK
jgi:metalloendopeptidase OMA1, mitochondrial